MNKKLNGHPPNGNGATPTGASLARSALATHGADEQEAAGLRTDEAEPPPEKIGELAEACVQYVERALGVRLDYSAETLPLLDHYLAEAQKTLVAQSEEDAKAARTTLPLLVQTAGAYFGEVIRRRYPSWWRAEGDDPMTFRVELETAYLAVSPMLFVYEGLARARDARG
ncbi:MAG: hypothetical protein R3F14_19480 [Polyangiaceae bacterium]